jgi:hypothetical protein
MHDRQPRFVFALPLLLLAACPEGGGPGPTVPPGLEPPPSNPPPPSVSGPDAAAPADAAPMPDAPPLPTQAFECMTGEPVLVTADPVVLVGKTAGAAVLGCRGALTTVAWTQTAGPPVELLSATTQAISFEPPDEGIYSFQVNYGLATGINGIGTVDVRAVVPPTPSRITVRTDQAVRSQGNTSVRAWPTLAVGEVMAGISWEQTRGPTVMLDMGDSRRIVFKAPEVTADTILGFRATVRTTSGVTDVDDVMVVVENAPQAPMGGTFSRTHVSRVYPYRRNTKYANVLVPCVFKAELNTTNGCPLSTLPLLGQQTPAGQIPTVDQVMERVLVSHDWMGANFEQFLQTQDTDGDFRRMLGSITAVVIGAHVRPALYYGATAAIYLDAIYLWLRPQERDVIDEAPDYRAGFGDGLMFSALTRWTLNNNYAWPTYRRDTRASRTVDSITNEFGRLLYHELSHAADFFPSSIVASLDNTKTPYDLYVPRFRAGQLPSSLLTTQSPLGSEEMKALGQVLFQGAPASDAQKAYQPNQVGDFFRSDRANDTYNYSTPREDLAMMVEEFMMAYRRGVRRDVAITNRFTPMLTADQLLVTWGQRGRIGDPAVKPRIRFVLSQILPWVDPSVVDSVLAPIEMPGGKSWYGTVMLPPPPATADHLPPVSVEEDTLRLQEELAARAEHLRALLAP